MRRSLQNMMKVRDVSPDGGSSQGGAQDLPTRFCWAWRWERSAEQTPLTPGNEGCSVPTVSATEQAVTPLLPLPHRPHTLYTVTHKDLTFAIFTKWLSISARIFSFWAVKISRTSQKLTCNTTFISHSKNSIFMMEHKNIIVLEQISIKGEWLLVLEEILAESDTVPSLSKGDRTREECTWLNLHVKATTLGAKLCFSFLFHPQLASSWHSEKDKALTNPTLTYFFCSQFHANYVMLFWWNKLPVIDMR